MKSFFRHTLCLIILSGLFALKTNAQDTLVCMSDDFTIALDCTPLIDATPASNGDIFIIRKMNNNSPLGDSLIYNSSDSNFFRIPGPIEGDTANNRLDIYFEFHSSGSSCKSTKTIFEIGTIDYANCIIPVTSLDVTSHNIEYPTISTCLSDTAVLPITDMPYLEPILLIPNKPGLVFGDYGQIYQNLSQPGEYMVSIETPYCISDSIVPINVVAGTESILSDQLSICRGTPVSDLDVGQIYGADIVVTDLSGESISSLETSDPYIIMTNDSKCFSVDTVFIEVKELPEFTIRYTKLCDRMLIDFVSESPVSEVSSVTWNYQTSGLEYEMLRSGQLFVEVQGSNGCSASDSEYVEVNVFAIQSAEYEKTDAECWNDGKLVIDQIQLENNAGDYALQIRNQLTHEIVSDISNIPEGLYNLQAVDNSDCIATLNNEIVIKQKCLEEYPVFTPNGDNVEDSYFIPYEGTVKVFDRYGNLIRELQTPAYWDGTDASGNLLGMGNYLLVTDSGRNVNVTIVR